MSIEDLIKAVKTSDLKKVRALLIKGANANMREVTSSHVDPRNTLLHISSSVEITRELLLHGARVDETNKYGDTPLFCAIGYRKGLGIVRELLKHGANVNFKNSRNNTALNKAVSTSNYCPEVIIELLDYGADINVRSSERFATPFVKERGTPLENSLRNPEVAKLLIEMVLLKNDDEGYRKINITFNHCSQQNQSKLLRYKDKCIREILQLKEDKVNANLSLYEFINKKNFNVEFFDTNNEGIQTITNQLFRTLYCDSRSYDIYKYIISEKIKLALAGVIRPYLKKGCGIHVFTISNEDDKKKKVILDVDSVCCVAEYVSNDDLVNLAIAFLKYHNVIAMCQQSDIIVAEVPGSIRAKRARIEEGIEITPHK